MAMLITPDRSHMISESEPNTSGVVEMSVAASISVKFSGIWPRAAQARNDQRNIVTPSETIS